VKKRFGLCFNCKSVHPVKRTTLTRAQVERLDEECLGDEKNFVMDEHEFGMSGLACPGVGDIPQTVNDRV
jgi:hypothetical protein